MSTHSRRQKGLLSYFRISLHIKFLLHLESCLERASSRRDTKGEHGQAGATARDVIVGGANSHRAGPSSQVVTGILARRYYEVGTVVLLFYGAVVSLRNVILNHAI